MAKMLPSPVCKVLIVAIIITVLLFPGDLCPSVVLGEHCSPPGDPTIIKNCDSWCQSQGSKGGGNVHTSICCCNS
ncbi:hypothetical protein ACP4OV_002241 [Aristida adscensionis]